MKILKTLRMHFVHSLLSKSLYECTNTLATYEFILLWPHGCECRCARINACMEKSNKQTQMCTDEYKDACIYEALL